VYGLGLLGWLGDEVELVCTGWGWPVPHVVWTRADGSNHVYRPGDFGVTLRDASVT